MREKIIFLILLIISNYTWSNSWSVSIPNSEFSGGYFRYSTILYLTDESFNDKTPLNYDCVQQRCWIQINTQVSGDPTQLRGADPGIPRIEVTGSENVGQALKKYFDNINRQYVYETSSTAPDRRGEGITWCGAMGISLLPTNGFSWQVMAGGECANLPPPNASCELLTENVELNHGVLDMADINGSTVTNAFQISCDSPTTIYMSITAPDLLPNSDNIKGAKVGLKDDDSLVSYLTVSYTDFDKVRHEDIDMSQRIKVKVDSGLNGGTNFDVTSKLQYDPQNPPEPGPFSSFAYIVISYL